VNLSVNLQLKAGSGTSFYGSGTEGSNSPNYSRNPELKFLTPEVENMEIL